jgi:uncharacterized protein with GYD domain
MDAANEAPPSPPTCLPTQPKKHTLMHATSVIWRSANSIADKDKQREVDMPIFVTQGRFTREYIKGGLAKPEDRHAAISRLCEQSGGKLLNLYFTLGHYDFIVISEMPDAKAASVLSFVATGGGGIEGAVTTEAFTTAEAKDLFERAGKIAGSYKPMGAS